MTAESKANDRNGDSCNWPGSAGSDTTRAFTCSFSPSLQSTLWGAEYIAAIGRVSQAPVTHVIYSHAHYDHIGGAGHLGAQVVVAHRATAEILGRHAGRSSSPVPPAE